MEGLKKPAFLMIAFLGVVAPLSVTEHHLIMQHKESLRQKAFEASLEGRITAAIRDFRNINATSLPLKTRSVLTELFRRYLGSGSADQHERQTIGEEFLLMMNHLYLIEITHLSVKNKSESGAKLFVHPADILYNSKEWKRLFWKDWDQVPFDLLTASLKRQFYHYAHAFDTKKWSSMTNEDWDDFPGPVKAAAFMAMIRQASEKYQLDKRINDKRAHNWFASIIICESYLENNAENTSYYNHDIGLAQLSPYARRVLSQTKDFFGFTKEDFAKPYNSIRGGAKWFEISLLEAGNDLALAIKAYNAGIADAKRNTQVAINYELRIRNAFSKYFERTSESKIWNHILRTSTEMSVK